MLYHTSSYFNLESLTPLATRSVLAFFISIFLSLGFGSRLINLLHSLQKKGQPIREDGPRSHLLTKKGTPTMGGLLILGSSILATLLLADLHNIFIWVSILVLISYGLVGFLDDYVKVTKQTANAMSAKMKLILQFSTALFAVIIISFQTPENSRYILTFPWFKDLSLNLWLFYIPFAMFVISGSSNAVNLSDGLDGLASSLLIISFFAVMIISYICGTDISQYFYIMPIEGTGELVVLCAAVIGACAGFLWFNAAPAQVFMGDTGSLSLGALLGTLAVILKHEILLVVVGAIFVLETISVMIQVTYYRRTGGKRFFKMAPIHHHFEQCGWPETRVVTRFCIVALIMAILGLTSLTLR